MQLGVDGCFVGSGIFKSSNPEKRAQAMVQAVTHYNDPLKLSGTTLKIVSLIYPFRRSIICTISFFNSLTEISENLGVPMVGINCDQIETKFEERESMMK